MVINVNLPHDLGDLLGSLSESEDGLLKNPRKCASGKSIAKELDRNFGGQPFNVIPWGIPTSNCYGTLVVGVGYNDDVEKRILEAYEHVSVKCRNTRYVIFWAAAWNGLSWRSHMIMFRGVTAILKPFLAEATILRS